MNYLFLGEDRLAKDTKIASIKAALFKDLQAVHFDHELLYGHKLDADVLQKALVALPALAPQRLIIIKQCHKLSTHAQGLVTDFLTGKPGHAVLVLDSDEGQISGILKEWSLLAQCQVLGASRAPVIFGVTDAMSARNLPQALKVLSELYHNNTHPLQVMGVLVWYWSQGKQRMSREKFVEGLNALESADLNIKRSRLDPEHAVEKVIVELVEIQKK